MMFTRQKALTIVYLLTLTYLSGCAVGQKFNYHGMVADIPVSGTKAVGTATHDQRPYVLSGDKAPNVVGLMRGGFGNPFNVTTESGRPLADEMTEAITASLAKKGFRVVPVFVLYMDSIDTVMEKLKATGAENLILLTLNEWKSDTYMNAGLFYDANLKIFDNTGKILAEANINGSDNLGTSFNTVSYSKIVVPDAFKKKIEELFKNPDVVKALQF